MSKPSIRVGANRNDCRTDTFLPRRASGKVSFKARAQQALSRGDWRKALENFQKHSALAPEDLRSRLKVAELLERLGRKKEAAGVYRQVAEAYARDGFLLQAISVNKMILRVDPSSKGVGDRLARLYAERNLASTSLNPLPPIPLLSELNEQELQLLLKQIELKTFDKGTPICGEGDPGDSLFIVSRGEVGVYKRMGNGEEAWIRNLEEGDFFGEFGFFTDRRRHASVRSINGCEILEIPRNRIEEMIRVHPRIKEVLQNLFRKRVLDLFLAVSPFFSGLNSGEREEVFKRFRLIRVPEETVLFRGGDPPDFLYMVKSGEVEIYTQNRKGRRTLLATLRSGSIFGETGLLFNKPRMAYARTTCPSELLGLSREDLEACLVRSPKLRSLLKEISLMRLDQTKEILFQEKLEEVKEGMV
ncbi:MAG: cyclic nucleotide-binding domain-containing protein [Syntrophaceae bacterium]|nr:cyclic nucleotide-binding domain-containing protein [Syntrophaceae bacterium]